MRAKWICTAIVSLLTVASIGGASPIAPQSKHTYTVVFQNGSGLPADYRQVVEHAGGSVTQELQAIGTVVAEASDPFFEQKLKSDSSVTEVGLEGEWKPVSVAFVPADVSEAPASGEAHDLYEQSQWDIKMVTSDGASWLMPGGTGLTQDGKPVVVAVIDTGIDYTHPDLKANYLYGKSFVPGFPDAMDELGHGTHVAGNIAANGRVMGVAPDLKLAAYRIFGPNNDAPNSVVAEAIIAAADDGVDVINLSVSGYGWRQDPNASNEQVNADIKAFDRAIDYAISKGVTVVGAAGNEGFDMRNPAALAKQLSGGDGGSAVHFPSNNNMIVVSSLNSEKQLAFYSNYGRKAINVAAPGGDLGPDFLTDFDFSKADVTKACLSTVPGGGYYYAIGTSQASPKVAALAGVLIAKHGKGVLSPRQVKSIIEESALDVMDPGVDSYSGAGLVQAAQALK